MTTVYDITLLLLRLQLPVPGAEEAFKEFVRRDHLIRMKGQPCNFEHLMLTALIESSRGLESTARSLGHQL